MEIKNLRYLIVNLVHALLFVVLPKNNKFIPEFAQNAGIGDAVIYINQLNKFAKYFPSGLVLYLHPAYISLLSSIANKNIALKNLHELDRHKGFINLSPHSLIGGIPKFNLVRSAQYILRALFRKLSIVLFDEYSLANRLSIDFLKDYFSADLIFKTKPVNVLIAPNSSNTRKSLTKENILGIINYINKISSNTIFTIVSKNDLNLNIQVKYVWSEDACYYCNFDYQIAICADSWLLHYLSSINKIVILYAKDSQYLTFLPAVAILKPECFDKTAV
jgi:hypothetical protein